MIARIRRYIEESYSELKKVTWPTREQVRNLDSRRMGLERQLRDAQKDDDRRKYRNELSDLDYSLRRARDRVRDAEWALDRMR